MSTHRMLLASLFALLPLCAAGHAASQPAPNGTTEAKPAAAKPGAAKPAAGKPGAAKPAAGKAGEEASTQPAKSSTSQPPTETSASKSPEPGSARVEASDAEETASEAEASGESAAHEPPADSPADREQTDPGSRSPSSAPPAEPSDASSSSAIEFDEPPDNGSLGSYQRHFQVQLGIRTSFIGHEGYGLFETTQDKLFDNYPATQLSLGGGGVLFAEGRLSLAVVGLWEYGGSEAELRGAETDLDVHRLAVGAELRHHFARWLYALVRLAPAAVNVRASIQEPTTNRPLYSRSWAFGFDATAGAAFQLYGKQSGASNDPRLWGIAEIGYGWTTETDLRFEPEGDDDAVPQRSQPLELGAVSIRGPMFRISAAVSF